MDEQKKQMTRRDVLITSAGVDGVGTVAALSTGRFSAFAQHSEVPLVMGGELPVKQIEDIMQTNGTVMNGVLSLELDRNDLHVTGPGGIPSSQPSSLTASSLFNRWVTVGRFSMRTSPCCRRRPIHL
ncbi:MAG: hypothetical protein JO183_06705 [Ktedonobacteraceae bacterium]|nr:hypothetical protein [Ktedonobacteraceae bacterium]